MLLFSCVLCGFYVTVVYVNVTAHCNTHTHTCPPHVLLLLALPSYIHTHTWIPLRWEMMVLVMMMRSQYRTQRKHQRHCGNRYVLLCKHTHLFIYTVKSHIHSEITYTPHCRLYLTTNHIPHPPHTPIYPPPPHPHTHTGIPGA